MEANDDEVKAMIADCVRIVHEDRERAQYNSLHEKYGAKPEDKGDGKTPPPKKDDEKPPADVKPKRGLWWNTADE